MREQHLIDMPFDNMARKYERTLKADGLLHYTLMEEHNVYEEVPTNLGKNCRLVSNREYEQ